MFFGKNINRYYLRYAHLIIIGVIALIFLDIYQLDIPKIIGEIIDGIKDANLTETILLTHIKDLLIILAIMFTGRFIWRVTLFGSAILVEADMRKRLFARSEDLSQAYFNEHKTGALMALFTNDLPVIRQVFGSGTIMFVDAILLGGLAFYRMFKIDITMTIFSVIPLVIVAISGVVIGRYIRQKFTARQKSFANLSDFTQESFSGLSVIRAFVKEGKELIAFSKLNKDYLDKSISFVKMGTLLRILIQGLIMSVVIVILGYGGYLVYNGTITIGKLTEYVSYFGTLTWPMMAIAELINMHSQARASLKRINNHLDYVVEIKDSPDVVSPFPIKGDIFFNDLSFSYPKSERIALENITFSLEAGKTLGIIGRTGSGKTTLVDLLLRIYNIPEEKIFIDGVDIMKIPLKSLRDEIAYVPQDGFLFSDSIKNNIDFAANTNDLAKIAAAASLADISENIEEFTLKYETILGERGVTISGGQKQRLSIARALIKDASILILDDAVSAVDTKTEEIILENLAKIRQDKTTIIIAHRISTVQSADKILVLDDGRVIGFGTHAELIASNEAYANMVRLQKLEDEVDLS